MTLSNALDPVTLNEVRLNAVEQIHMERLRRCIVQRIKWPLLVAMVAGSFGMLNQPAVAEGSRLKEELSREIVRSERGTFKIEEFSLCTITPRWGGEGKRIQFRSSAQGPANQNRILHRQ